MRQDTEERAVLEQIASNLEAEGFKVIVQPSLHIVPAFLRDYEPDAIAIGRDQNLVIEIARSSERTAESRRAIVAGASFPPCRARPSSVV